MSWKHVVLNDEQYNFEYFSKTDNVCRICWCQNANRDISKLSSDTLETAVFDKITYCLDIDLNCFDNLNKICDDCTHEIDSFYEFKIFCRSTDLRLQGIFKTGCDIKKAEVKLEFSDLELTKDEAVDNFFEDEILLDDLEKTNKKVRNKKKKDTKSLSYCDICCLQFENEQNLSSHNSESHGIEENGALFKCFGCEKRFRTQKARICHEIKFCKGLKDGYKCVLCERCLPKRRMYEIHMRDHLHNVSTELPEDMFKCRKCLKLFRTKECLNEHFVSEHGDAKKNFVCDTCGRVFTRQDYLYKHMLTHAGIKRYNCPHCDFKATQRSSLTVHIRKHTGERPYCCDMCPQRCISSSNLRAHRRRHLGVKKFECTICNKKFGYKISLDEHVSSTHERTEMHTCEHCGATYTRVRGLRRHLAAKHSKHKNEQTHILVSESDIQNNKPEDTLKTVQYEFKEGDLLLKDSSCDVFMV